MAKFGWGFVEGNIIRGGGGETGSLQYKVGALDVTGSDKLVYKYATNELFLSGNLQVSGGIYAKEYITEKHQVISTVAHVSSTGSTNFGDTNDDFHSFTGSLDVRNSSGPMIYAKSSNSRIGIKTDNPQEAFHINATTLISQGVTSSAAISAHKVTSNAFTASGDVVASGRYHGDGRFLVNVPRITQANSANNRLITSVDADNINAEAGLTFDGSTLTLTGDADVSANLFVGGNITHKDDGDTKIAFTDNRIDIHAGNSNPQITMRGDTNPKRIELTRADVKIQGADPGDSNTIKTLLFTDYDQYKVGIKTEAPSHDFTVVGAVSASAFHGDGSNLTGIETEWDGTRTGTTQITGSLFVTASTNPMYIRGATTSSAAATSYLGLMPDGTVVVMTGSAGAGGGIGAAEDGAYDDGIYGDFTTETPVGTVIDRFNELLKKLAPNPAPNVNAISHNEDPGINTKLSFDGSNSVTGYTAVSNNGGFYPSILINQNYSGSVSGSNTRLGVYSGTTNITGKINFSTAAQQNGSHLNYASGAFGNANEGTLKLILNGTTVHSVALSGLAGSGNPGTGSANSKTGNSGFSNVSILGSAYDSLGTEFDLFRHRTANYIIHTADQVKGWNYLRVVHTVGSTDYSSNYIEWINDTDASGHTLSVANARIEGITLVGSKYLSGVEYNTSAQAEYKVDVLNMYRNTYPTGNVMSFTNLLKVTAPGAFALEAIGGGEDERKVIMLTGSLTSSVTNLLNGSIRCAVSAEHPLKTNLSNAGSVTVSGFLIDSRNSPAPTNLSETFVSESFRVPSGSFANQAAVTANDWRSELQMTASSDAGHRDGLLFYDQKLYSPLQGANGGNFAGITNGPANNANYSIATGNRTFYRKIQNSSGAAIKDMKISFTKTSTTINNSALGTGNANAFIKLPGTTGFMDISQNFAYGSIGDGDGALIDGASDNNSNVFCLTFGTASLADDDYAVFKLVASASWAGNIDQIAFQLGAADVSAPTEAPVLDDIDCNDSGTGAKLSFGPNNAISGYSRAQGSSISLSDIDTNGDYTLSGDRRGVFSAYTTIDGELNEDVGSNGNSYPANAFRNAYTGSLVLEVNGSEIHTTDIGSSQNAIASSYNGDGSGFHNISAVAFSKTSDLVPDYAKTYRTGKYKIVAASQRLGWEYARVIHRIGGSDTATNYVRWAVDTDNTSLSDATVALSNFDHTSIFYQSGVKYFAAAPSASYTYAISNLYKNVYSNAANAISFPTTTQCSVNNIKAQGTGVTTSNVGAAVSGLPALNTSVANAHTHDLYVTGTVLFDNSTSFEGNGTFVGGNYHTASVNSLVKHPFKSNLTTATLSKNGFLVFNQSAGSTNVNTQEYFNLETYRIVSGNYADQASATGGGSAWNSQRSMNDVGNYPAHSDGLLYLNGYLTTPVNVGIAGDCRNVANGGALQSPPSNVNYSSGALTKATRTFYRYFRNNTSNDRSSITVTLYGSGSLVAKTTSLGTTGDFHCEVKIPHPTAGIGTAWLDAGKAYTSNNSGSNGSGALVGATPPLVIAGGGSSITTTFNGGSLRGNVSASPNGEVVVIKISAHKDWLGYLSRIGISYS